MMSKKINFLIVTLFFLFSAATHCCLEIIALKKQQPIVFKSLYFENLELKRELVKKELELQHRSHIILGLSPAAAAFFYSIYTAKNNDDFDKALTKRGELYISLYCAEKIEECSALGIITIADSMPFLEKKECVQKLLLYKFVPTLRDKELAFLEKCKRYGNEICNKIILLGYVLENHRRQFFKRASIEFKSLRIEFKSSRKSRQRIAFFLFNFEELLF